MTSDFHTEYRFIYRLSSFQIDQLLELYDQAWWSHERTKSDTLKAIANSTLVLGVANSSNELVGFARVISDLVYRAVVFDLIVREDQRGKGIAKEILKVIVHHDVLQDVEFVDMYSNNDLLEYYVSLGFKDMSHSIKLLRYDHT